jgi:hypothetical protein
VARDDRRRDNGEDPSEVIAMFEMETLGGVVAGGALVLLYQRLRKRYPQMTGPDVPLRAAGDAVTKLAGSTAQLGSRAVQGIEDAGAWAARTPPARVVGGAVAGAVGTTTELAGSATSRIASTIHPDGSGGVVASATRFHRPDCRYARGGTPMDRDAAVEEGLEPCSLCEP